VLRNFLSICILCCIAFTSTGQGITGLWQGVIYQVSGGSSPYYPASLELKQTGTVVTGVATSKLPDGSPSYLKINVSGTFINDTFRYTIGREISQIAPPPGYYWCTNGTGVLVYDAVNEKLKGPTNSPGCAGPGSAEYWRLRILSDTVFCEGTAVNLRVSGNGVKWYSDFAQSRLVNQGLTFSPGINASTTYYLTQTHYNTQSPAIAVQVIIKPRTYRTINQTICDGQSYLGYSKTGKYIDTLRSSTGCDSIRTINLIVTAKPILQVSKTICEGQSYMGHSIQGKYFDTIRTASGCDTVISLDLKVAQPVSVRLGADFSLCDGDTFVLKTATYPNYLWEDGSSSSAHIIRKPGMYNLTVSNECGIFGDTVVVTSRICPMDFPNAFTPNGDGYNDVFRIVNPVMLLNYHLAVYNRWGQKVFETTNPLTGWNGQFKGKDQPQGQYVWQAEYKSSGTVKKQRGGVHLLR
jgi:gliding motility-associated-like protein